MCRTSTRKRTKAIGGGIFALRYIEITLPDHPDASDRVVSLFLTFFVVSHLASDDVDRLSLMPQLPKCPHTAAHVQTL